MAKKPIKEKFEISIIDDDIVFYVEQTKVTADSSHVGKEEVLTIVQDILKPRKMLIDLSAAQLPPLESRKILVALMEEAKFYKVAVFGANSVLKAMAQFILAATGIKNADFFNTKDEALVWLRK